MEEYMKALLEQIRCKPAKKLVEQEIRGHILEQYEENLDKGMEETLAMEEAVKDMGNPIETGIALDAIHKPQISWGMIGILAVLSFFKYSHSGAHWQGKSGIREFLYFQTYFSCGTGIMSHAGSVSSGL